MLNILTINIWTWLLQELHWTHQLGIKNVQGMPQARDTKAPVDGVLEQQQ